MIPTGTRKKAALMLAVLGALSGIAWWQRAPLLAAYYVHCLSRADEASRDLWAARVAPLGDAALPAILNALEGADDTARANLEAALRELVRNWGDDTARRTTLLDQLTARHAGALALHVAGALMDQVSGDRWIDPCRKRALAGLASADSDQRLAALQLVLRPLFRHEHDMLVKVAPLLRDKAIPVRKAALLALGPARDLVSDDDLLPFLHDPNEEVQGLCALTLRGRGLPERHIYLARLLGDARPGVRLQVLDLLGEDNDLEPGVWLRRLCQDPAPAVRAAAIRAALTQRRADMRGCLSAMAQQDTSPTVRELARHYLIRLQSDP